MIETKRCPACKALKDRSEFFQNGGRADGLSVYCKPCERGYKNSTKSKNQPSSRKNWADNMLRHLEIDPSEY